MDLAIKAIPGFDFSPSSASQALRAVIEHHLVLFILHLNPFQPPGTVAAFDGSILSFANRLTIFLEAAIKARIDLPSLNVEEPLFWQMVHIDLSEDPAIFAANPLVAPDETMNALQQLVAEVSLARARFLEGSQGAPATTDGAVLEVMVGTIFTIMEELQDIRKFHSVSRLWWTVDKWIEVGHNGSLTQHASNTLGPSMLATDYTSVLLGEDNAESFEEWMQRVESDRTLDPSLRPYTEAESESIRAV